MDTETTTPAFKQEHLEEYLVALQAGIDLNTTLAQLGTHVSIQPGKKYIKVVLSENGRSRSVHAFIEKATGALIKAAGWNAPQRKSNGDLSVRYQLADDTVRHELCEMLQTNPGAHCGGYLYER